jgi:hypothetical protein
MFSGQFTNGFDCSNAASFSSLHIRRPHFPTAASSFSDVIISSRHLQTTPRRLMTLIAILVVGLGMNRTSGRAILLMESPSVENYQQYILGKRHRQEHCASSLVGLASPSPGGVASLGQSTLSSPSTPSITISGES